jgi:uncharacterized membrane protein YkoI
MNHKMLTGVAVFSIAAAAGLHAQVKPDTTKKPVQASGVVATDTLVIEWYRPTGTVCSSVDVTAAKAVEIKSDLYKADAGMISPDSAKIVALCAVPGQIGSGEMNVDNGITQYAIDIIPNGKKTHAKVIVDAETGAVLSSKQFGGLRGLAGWVRESGEHKANKVKPPTDTTTTMTKTTITVTKDSTLKKDTTTKVPPKPPTT